MAMKNLNIRIDEDLKEEAEEIFSELGMTMTTALTLFLRASVRYGGIPFELKLDNLKKEASSSAEESNINNGMAKTFSSLAEMMEDLEAED